ncbi:MAG TPA: TonB family protein [Verrucomicrobiae bacterium]|nr:TonB family protein [Verrucomicrobiae bacterium]
MLKLHFSSRPAASIKRILASTTLAFCLIAGFAPVVLGQKSPKVTRKVLSEVKPAYPATLKNLHIEGLVRLTVIVLPNGNVAKINVRGGNPILVENAVKAVKDWKYAPGVSQTEEEVVLNFTDKY